MEIRRSNNLTFPTDSIVFICGMPGSGKSTLASKFLTNFSVIDIDDIYTETELLLNWNQKSKLEQITLSDSFLDTLNSRLVFSIRRSLRNNPITFVIINATNKLARQSFIQKFVGRYKHCIAIVLDVDKKTLVNQYQNDQYNEGMKEFLSNFDDFKKQIDETSFEEFDIVYIVDKTMVNSINIKLE